MKKIFILVALLSSVASAEIVYRNTDGIIVAKDFQSTVRNSGVKIPESLTMERAEYAYVQEAKKYQVGSYHGIIICEMPSVTNDFLLIFNEDTSGDVRIYYFIKKANLGLLEVMSSVNYNIKDFLDCLVEDGMLTRIEY